MPMDDAALQPIRFTGHRHLSSRLVLSTLTGRPIRVSKIRSENPTSPGLAPHETSLLRLLDSITNGSHIEFSYTGTTLLYKPGLIHGSAAGYGASGGVIRHELPADNTHGISYFLMPICILAPFAKNPVNVLFTGPGVITSSTPSGDVSVDTVRTAVLPLYQNFGVMVKLEIRINKRSSIGQNGKGGAGEVQLVLGHQIRVPRTLHLMAPGTIRRIRGVAYSIGVSGSNNARMTESARKILNPIVADIYIFGDLSSAPKRKEESKMPGGPKTGIGFGLSLVAETSAGCLYSADVASPPQGGVAAEDIGRQCAFQLLEHIGKGGCVEPLGIPTVLTMMSQGAEDVGRVVLSKENIMTEEVVQLARDMKAFGLHGWGLREVTGDEEDKYAVMIVKGKGIGNVGRKMG